jgi:transcriptional/translational regulatory protein YebC/TACO1
LCGLDVSPKGVIVIDLNATTETLWIVALKPAEDITSDTGSFEVVTPPDSLEDVKLAIEKGDQIISAEITMHPSNMVS